MFLSDIKKINDACEKHAVEGRSLNATSVQVTNCIEVSNIGPKVTKDTVRFYFENKRRSGGAVTEKLDFEEGRDYALVYFVDYKGLFIVL